LRKKTRRCPRIGSRKKRASAWERRHLAGPDDSLRLVRKWCYFLLAKGDVATFARGRLPAGRWRSQALSRHRMRRRFSVIKIAGKSLLSHPA